MIPKVDTITVKITPETIPPAILEFGFGGKGLGPGVGPGLGPGLGFGVQIQTLHRVLY